MKLTRLADVEIPLGDPEGLSALRVELKWVLGVVDFALSDNAPTEKQRVSPKRAVKTVVSSAPAPKAHFPAPQGPTLAARIRDSIDKAAARFMSSDIYNQFPKAARGAIKDELKKRRLDGSIEVVTMGKGRVATVYAKKPKERMTA